MAYDANLVLQASTTKTATFNGAAVDLKTGVPRRGMTAKVYYSAAANATGSNTVTFSIDHSDDNSTWYSLANQVETPLTLSTTAQASEAHVDFSTGKRYARLTVTVAGAGTVPTVTYLGQLGLKERP